MAKFTVWMLALWLVVPVLAWGQGICDELDGAWIEDENLLRFVHRWEDNCGVDAVAYEVTVDDWQIHVVELVTAPAMAYCICPYDGQPKVSGLAPGEYQVIWDYEFTCTGEPEVHITEHCPDFTVTVPEYDVTGEPALAGCTVTGCGIVTTAVPGADDGRRTWTEIRGRF